MKLKTLTLLAFIGVILFAVNNLITILVNMNVIDLGSNISLFYNALNIFYFIGWLLIGLFFFELYKRQK